MSPTCRTAASACHAASVFQMNNSGFHAEITLEKENLVFFSVPYDDALRPMSTGRRPTLWRWTRD